MRDQEPREGRAARCRVRQRIEADRARVDTVLRAAFGGPAEAELVATLPADDVVLALVAEVDGEVAGVVVAVRIRAEVAGVAGIAPLAVHPVAQGRGVGAALMREVLARLEAGGWRAAVVMGDPAYYVRFGFEEATRHGVTSDWGGPAFQVRGLTGSPRVGRVRYPVAFDALG